VTLTLPVLRDAADVVARQVDQHQVLGALLRVGLQFGGQLRVLLRRGAARPRAGQRPDGDLGPVGGCSWRTRISGLAPTIWKLPRS
jgi:hypothetical protein